VGDPAQGDFARLLAPDSAGQVLRSYFSQQPAYVLREDASTGEALAKKYAKGIEVKPGEIVIPFTN
ncbi:DUF1439 domain-containing protein, partial [Klebsiella pneumoniae]|nr:DUF1439 domain-containing protein [Klebsiella pneumoniae]